MIRFDVRDASTESGARAWLELWRASPMQDVMAHPDYVRLFARPCDRVVAAAGRAEAGGAVLFPLILRPLSAESWAAPDERRWDATSPYGYGGPQAWGPGPRDDAGFWSAFAGWCRDERIVTTVVRLSLFPAELAPLPGPAEVVRDNVVVSLEGGHEAVQRGYESKVRRWVETATRSGLVVDVDEEGRQLDGFLRVYRRTMDRHAADAWYYFSSEFFETIVRRLRGSFAIFSALRDGEVVSSDFVLVSAERVYYFLGGTIEEAFPFGANYLVKHTVASWSVDRGKKAYVLGGGYEPHDGLIRYKRGFARRGVVPFRVGKLVHDEQACRELVALRAETAARRGETWTPSESYFPPYRP